MTFSGLPSIRDPKQSLKHSNSSASSTTSSSSTSPSTSAAVVNSTASSSKQPDINSNIKLNDSLPVSTDPNRMGSRSGTLVSSGEPLSAQLIEKSFEDLVQASMNNPSETLVDLRNSNNDNNNARVPSFQKEMKHEQNQQQYQEQQLQQQQHKQQQETRVSTPSTTVATKKKGSPQSFSPAHSAAYRKRLNVNQVCDWCRYRKIRCDRESPCNSCQHSKRECIRTPASQLLNNIKKNSTSDDVEQTESISSSEVGSRSKRSRVDTRDALSPRGRKSYRGSSTSSHHSSSYTSYSSDQDQCGDYDGGDDESDSVISSASPTVGSLTLAGLGLSGLTNLASTNNLSGNFGVPSNLETTRHGSNFQLVSGSANESTLSLLGGGQGGFQDQEHLDRMKRIEALLSNVVPGAAEFIATGATSSERKPLSVVTQGLEQLHRDIVTTPQEQLSKISLASPVVNSTSSWSSTPLQNESQQSPMPTIDYVERMKRIELLLSTVKDLPLAKTIASQSRGHIPPAPLHPDEDMESAKKPSKAYTKKQSKNELKKNRAYNGNGAVVKRPHVAAGFAGQKPPPKLPQAIAEAAQRKQSARKKRNAAGAVRASFTVSTLTASSPNMASDSAAETDSKEATPGASPFQSSADRGQENRIVTPSPTASFDIPSVIENDHTTPLSQGQHRQFYVTNHRESTSFHSQQQQYKQQPFHAYSHPSSVSDIGSLTIPFSEPIASYGSLVVPASSSTCSSATSSPRSSRAESVAFDGSASQGGLNISSDVASDVSASLDQIMFPGSHGYLQDQQLSQVHQLSGGFNMESFDFRENNFPASDNTPHPLAQQYHNYQQPQQHSIHIGQDAGFGTFVMNSDESLEMLMKKNVGSLEGLVGNFINDATTSPMDSLLQGPGSLGSALYDISPTAEQFSFLQQHQQQEQPQQQYQTSQANRQQFQQRFQAQDTSNRSILIPNHSSSFTVPSNPQATWSLQGQQQQQQQSAQSINISASDSPQGDIDLDLDFEPQSSDKQSQMHQKQQEQMSAHALFQQQHHQQQQRHMAQLQQQQQQIRKNSFAGGLSQQHQHRASTQHQHQQSFYIPQMQDDDDEGDL